MSAQTIGTESENPTVALRVILQGDFVRAFVWAAIGCILAMAAWGPARTPALALLLPVLVALAPSRAMVFLLTAAYHLGVIRFLPEFAGVWFESPALGYLLWCGTGILSALAWALAWTSSTKPLHVGLSMIGMLVLTLLPPFGMLLPGHPIVGLGYLVGAMAWVGVTLFVVAWVAAPILIRCYLPKLVPTKTRIAGFAVATGLGILFVLFGDAPSPDDGKVAGKVGAMHTRWGGFPPKDSLEVVNRISRMGDAAVSLAGGEGELRTVVFPESIVGFYEPGLYAVIELQILRKTRPAGQTIVLGGDLELEGGTLQKTALAFRPEGSSHVVSRQPVPVAEWAPWADRTHRVNWLANNTLDIGGGVKAGVFFCYEEYIPALHLISAARYEQNMIVVLANLWATSNPLASSIQASHTEGMARLFGRKWVRSLNLPKTGAAGA